MRARCPAPPEAGTVEQRAQGVGAMRRDAGGLDHRHAHGALERREVELAPLCPHMGEEIWSRLGHATTITYVPFPVADAALLVDDTVEYPVQVNGKVRARVVVAADADPETVKAIALSDDKVLAALAGETPKKVIVVPGRMVNLVV